MGLLDTQVKRKDLQDSKVKLATVRCVMKLGRYCDENDNMVVRLSGPGGWEALIARTGCDVNDNWVALQHFERRPQLRFEWTYWACDSIHAAE